MQSKRSPRGTGSSAGSQAIARLAALACAALSVVVGLAMHSALGTPAMPRPAVVTSLPDEATSEFARAVSLQCSGRHAEAYGRFVALANEGDAVAGRVALALHELGPTLYGSDWDASAEQLDTWARWRVATDADALDRRTGVAANVLGAMCASPARVPSGFERGGDPSLAQKRRTLDPQATAR